MRKLLVPLVMATSLVLASCVFERRPEPELGGRWDSCTTFAFSGGYPVAWGGDYGGNPNFLYLPGQRPVPLSGEYLQRRLETEDALMDYCRRNLVPQGAVISPK